MASSSLPAATAEMVEAASGAGGTTLEWAVAPRRCRRRVESKRPATPVASSVAPASAPRRAQVGASSAAASLTMATPAGTVVVLAEDGPLAGSVGWAPKDDPMAGTVVRPVGVGLAAVVVVVVDRSGVPPVPGSRGAGSAAPPPLEARLGWARPGAGSARRDPSRGG